MELDRAVGKMGILASLQHQMLQMGVWMSIKVATLQEHGEHQRPGSKTSAPPLRILKQPIIFLIIKTH